MTDVDTAAVRQVLDALAAHGPYFTVAVRAERPTDGWRPVDELYGGSALGGLLDVAAKRLGTDDLRVAGSILHQGYAARLWSVVAGAALTGGVVPRLHALWWRSTELALVELLTVRPTGVRAAAGVARQVADAALTEHVYPLAHAVRSATGVSEQVLAGNTASALVGALRVLADTDVDVAGRALGAELFALPDLRGTGTAYLDGSPARFERDSCCLFYRVPNGGLCGDCVLARRPE